ncbi:unnamed protein product [Xylocopa violacea]|uniref:ATP synthase subunit f, mitochondrial n=1 Tax=Xylocopa violacea TaxID=135666 RepID=A0ABP1N6M4_XYLVO
MSSELRTTLRNFFRLDHIGNYPVEYDEQKHGPYDPSRYYGKPDTPFGEVKLNEIGEWIGRREKGPRRLAALISRAFWRWQMKYMQPRKANFCGYYQLAVAGMIFFYSLNYLRLRGHRRYKYH